MKALGRIAIVVVVAGVAAAAVLTRDRGGDEVVTRDTTSTGTLPRVIDLGSQMCMPCQTMMTELDRLTEMTQGTIHIEFIDVNENQAAARTYAVRVIPTQIFLSETGTELWRHEGVVSVEDMVAKWFELGYDIVPEPAD